MFLFLSLSFCIFVYSFCPKHLKGHTFRNLAMLGWSCTANQHDASEAAASAINYELIRSRNYLLITHARHN